jgi:hypothetical protein
MCQNAAECQAAVCGRALIPPILPMVADFTIRAFQLVTLSQIA